MPKDIWLNATQYFFKKIPTKRELQQIILNYLFDNEFEYSQGFKKIILKKTFLILVNDVTLPSENPLRFKKNL